MAIDLTIEDGVAIITINRPERKNAILLAMRIDIEQAFLKCQDDDSVRAIILTGAGSDFSAGADVGEMGGGGVRGSLYRMRHMHRMSRAIASTNKPVIAAVEGVCIGMSWAMALSTDMVVAAENARFQFAFRHIGLAPDGGAAFLLTRYVPIQRAKDIMYSGRFVSGTEAAQLGLALHATPPGEALAKAKELAASFAVAPTIAIGMAKRQFEAATAQTFDQALDFEANIQPLMVQTEDFKEGTTSFKEKRKAVFVAN
ncbi:enoyl-CoA hydratase/isomerase family protein [Brevundimonas sp.]|jgi:2-(1,2-epoxy-1,2-dihydrophenyl)acetyl-CoA isomerase|uniref:enoyl-CoA hydratase/isomerase family protein n=1 Tax=Brevundimonas sp. TaxID=1871086 RepID=UPI003784FAE5